MSSFNLGYVRLKSSGKSVQHDKTQDSGERKLSFSIKAVLKPAATRGFSHHRNLDFVFQFRTEEFSHMGDFDHKP